MAQTRPGHARPNRPTTVLRRLIARLRRPFRTKVRVAATLIVVRVALWLVPTRTVLRYAATRAKQAAHSHTLDGVYARKVAGAVISLSRFVPQASCLTQALTAQIVLARAGSASTLYLGVRRDAGNRLEAHAWLEAGGEVIVGGGTGLASFHPFPDVQELALSPIRSNTRKSKTNGDRT